ncbi:MAG: LCP family protein [Oscillospiraceae bacterium]|jgi:hypothetical protein|nr:LCP family protein [Oscillospiraceae bacterium]
MPKYDLEFKPRRKRRMEQAAHFLLGFLAIFLLLGVISVIIMQRDGLLDQLFGGKADPTQDALTTEPPEGWQYTGSAVLLLSETDDSGTALRFVALLRVDLAKRSFNIFPLSPQAKAPVNGEEITLEQAMQRGGVKQLKAAAEALTEGRIDKYIQSRDAGFTQAVNTMGSVPVQVPQRVEYKSKDFTLTLSAGMNNLPGDRLLRYFRYLGTLQADGLRQQGELLRVMLETYLVPKYAESPEKLKQRYEKLVNLAETDVNSIDFDAQTDMLFALLQGGGITVTNQEY